MMCMSFLSDKFLRITRIVNAWILISLLPIFVFVFLWAPAPENLGIPRFLQFAAYLIALISGLIAFKWRKFLYVSLGIWSVFFIGFQLETRANEISRRESCMRDRANPLCVEGKGGTMVCYASKTPDGQLFGQSVSVDVCAGIPKE